MRRIFAYGTLEVPEVMETLLGRRPGATPAILEDHARSMLRGRSYPGMVPSPGAVTDGVLWEPLDAAALALLDRFEGPIYQRAAVRVRAGARGELAAEAYLLLPAERARLGPEPWDRETFVRRHLHDTVEQCAALRLGNLR